MELDNRQKKVVESEASHILCLASGGAGKTRTLTERIKHLIKDKKVKPEGIVAICFTNLAAEEMKKENAARQEESFSGRPHSPTPPKATGAEAIFDQPFSGRSAAREQPKQEESFAEQQLKEERSSHTTSGDMDGIDTSSLNLDDIDLNHM